MAAFFGFIWILTLFVDLSLILLFAVVLHVGMIFVLLLSLFVSSPEVAWRARTSFAGGEWGAAHPRLMRAFQLFIFCVLFAYPIANGYFLFNHDLPSDTLTLNIFKTSLLFFF